MERPGLARHEASSETNRRAQIMALVVLSGFLMSGGVTTGPYLAVDSAPRRVEAGPPLAPAAGAAALSLAGAPLALRASRDPSAIAERSSFRSRPAGRSSARIADAYALSTAALEAAELVERSLLSVETALSPRDRARIGAAILRYSRHYGLDPDLVTAIMLVESDARPWAHSPAGAVGLMQVMPHMMRPMGLAGNAATIESNIEAGCFILANNIRRLGVEDGISAYFWGSRIRGVAYLEKVLEARARVRGLRTS
jgi:soluble lytic murein transglycosylase-like protein